MAGRGNPKTGGRKKHTPNKVNAERTEAAKRQGPLPSENMLTIARNMMALAAKYQPVEGNENADEQRYIELLKVALDANNKAAPYYEQRLASVQHLMRFDLSGCTDEELAVLERIARRNSTAERDTGGEGATRH